MPRSATRYMQSTLERGNPVMKTVQAVILAALLITGSALLLGFALESGPLLQFGTYFGWFAMAASLAVFLALLVLLSIRGRLPNWGGLCLSNAGLAFIGASLLGLDPRSSITIASAVILGIVAAIVAGRFRFFSSRLSVVVLVIIVASLSALALNHLWPLAGLGIGIVLVGSQLVEVMDTNRSTRLD